MLNGKKYLFYWHDGGGLGHLVRQTRIAEFLLKNEEAISIYGITGCYKYTNFFLPKGMDLIKLPSFTYTNPPKRKPLTNFDFEKVVELRKILLSTVIKEYNPDVILVDHDPLGLYKELLNIQWGENTNGILGIRGVLEDKQFVEQTYFSKVTLNLIERQYAKILVYIDPNIFCFEDYYKIPLSIVEKIHYTGYITPYCPFTKSEARKKLNILEDDIVIFSHFGGSFNAENLIKTTLKCLNSNKIQFTKAFLFTGSYMSDQDFNQILIEIKSKKIACERFCKEVLLYLTACDLFIGAGGYNTVSEIIATEANSLLVDRHLYSNEQTIHLDILKSKGIVHSIKLANYNIELLPKAINMAIKNPIDKRSFCLKKNSKEEIIKLLE